jgi:hypothetical protein
LAIVASTSPAVTLPQGSAATVGDIILTPKQLTAAVLNLTQQMDGIRDLLLQRSFEPPPLPPPTEAPAALSTATSDQGGPSARAEPVPIHQMTFPPSPSPIPSWPAPGATFTVAPTRTTTSGQPRHSRAATSSSAPRQQPRTLLTDDHGVVYPMNSAYQPAAPPRYYKLEFPTFDGSSDPLN